MTLLLHYGKVHSRHDRSTSYLRARRTRLTNAKDLIVDCTITPVNPAVFLLGALVRLTYK